MVLSLRPPRRKITCGNWNNTDIHIDWKCMKQPMWEVPAFWLTKNSIYNVWTSTPIFVDWWKILYLSISSGSKCRQTLRRSDTEESLQTGSDRLTPWPLDPLTPWPIPIIPSPSSTLAKIWRQELCEQRRRSSHNTLSRFLQRSTALGSSSYERNIQMCG